MVVDEVALRRRAREYLVAFRDRWPRSDVAFASKAFPCTAIQRLMAEEGLHLDVAGGGEVITALAAGADPARMLLHGNAKTDEELELAVGNGVGLVVVDNFDDIDRLERIVEPGRRQACLVRVVPGVGADTHAAMATGHAGSNFGLLPEDARVAIDRIRRSRRAALRRRAHPRRLATARRRAAGGGGGSQSPNWAASTSTTSVAGSARATPTATTLRRLAEYAQTMIDAARALIPADARVIVEPGRSMVAAAGCTVYRVTTVKRGSVTMSPSTAGWATTSRCRCTASGSRRPWSTGWAAATP